MEPAFAPHAPPTSFRCVTYRAKQNKFQSQVSIVKFSEKQSLPPRLQKLTALTGGFYTNPEDAARASDK